MIDARGISGVEMKLKYECKQKTLFIMVKNSVDYYGLKGEGYTVLCPYKDRSIFGRLFREICFMLGFQKPWYSRKFLKYEYQNIIVRDPLITRKYLEWLKAKNPEIRLIFTYANMVGKAKHLMPNEIPSEYKVWTYDGHDSEKYRISLIKSKAYYECFVYPKKQSRYDILFVGKDKGRLNYLLELKYQFESMGLRTKFLITADGKLSKRDKRYGRPVPYKQIAEWISESKAILNVTLPEQQGITVRDMESVFNKVKLITTNKHIVDSEIYDERNVYILDGFGLIGIVNFINEPYHEGIADPEQFTLEKYIKEIIG